MVPQPLPKIKTSTIGLGEKLPWTSLPTAIYGPLKAQVHQMKDHVHLTRHAMDSQVHPWHLSSAPAGRWTPVWPAPNSADHRRSIRDRERLLCKGVSFFDAFCSRAGKHPRLALWNTPTKHSAEAVPRAGAVGLPPKRSTSLARTAATGSLNSTERAP